MNRCYVFFLISLFALSGCSTPQERAAEAQQVQQAFEAHKKEEMAAIKAAEEMEAIKAAEEMAEEMEAIKAAEEMAANKKQAMQNAKIACHNNCDHIFSLAQIYVSEASDMKIQVSTNSLIETYSPTKVGHAGMKVFKVMQGNGKGYVQLKAMCKYPTNKDRREFNIDQFPKIVDICDRKEILLHGSFKEFIDEQLGTTKQ